MADGYLETWIAEDIKITDEQIEYARKINELEYQTDRENGVTDAPIKDSLDSKEQAFIGNLGEVIFADFYELKRPYEDEDPNLEGDDGGVDFDVNGITYQVKTTDYMGSDRHLLVQNRLMGELNKVDRLVMIQCDLQEQIAHISLAMSVHVFKIFCEDKDLGRPSQGMTIEKMEEVEKGDEFPFHSDREFEKVFT